MSDPTVLDLGWSGLAPSYYDPPPPPPPVYTSRGFAFVCAVAQGSPDVCSDWLFLQGIRQAHHRADDTAAALNTIYGDYGMPSFAVVTDGAGLVPRVLRWKARFGDGSGAVYYAFAGTTNLSQWASYVLNTGQVERAGVPGRIFEAFANIFDALYPAILADLNSVGRNAVVFLAGHSLGGALAEIVAKALRNRDNVSAYACTTFGSPRVGDKDFGKLGKKVSVSRIILPPDPVPQVPPSTYVRKPDLPILSHGPAIVPCGYKHTSVPIQFTDDGSMITGGAQDTGTENAKRAYEALRSFLTPGVPIRHALNYYASDMSKFVLPLLAKKLPAATMNRIKALHSAYIAAGW